MLLKIYKISQYLFFKFYLLCIYCFLLFIFIYSFFFNPFFYSTVLLIFETFSVFFFCKNLPLKIFPIMNNNIVFTFTSRNCLSGATFKNRRLLLVKRPRLCWGDIQQICFRGVASILVKYQCPCRDLISSSS